MSPTRGRVVRTPGAQLPYKVMLTHDGHAQTSHAFDHARGGSIHQA